MTSFIKLRHYSNFQLYCLCVEFNCIVSHARRQSRHVASDGARGLNSFAPAAPYEFSYIPALPSINTYKHIRIYTGIPVSRDTGKDAQTCISVSRVHRVKSPNQYIEHPHQPALSSRQKTP